MSEAKKRKRKPAKNPAVTWLNVKVPAALLSEARRVRERVLEAGADGLPEHLRDAIRLDVRRVGLAQIMVLGIRSLAAELARGGEAQGG